MPIDYSKIKCFQLHVGNLLLYNQKGNTTYLKRFSFDLQNEAFYDKHDIINADSQMQSLIEKGVNIKYGHFSNRKSIRAIWKGGFKLRNICKKENIDIVHVYWGTTTALMVVLFSPVPIVVSFSGSDLLGQVNPSGKKTISGLVSRIISVFSGYFAKGIITKSEIMKSGLPGPLKRKTTVIPNGIDLTGFKPITRKYARNKLKWSHEDPVVLFFSSNGASVKNPALARSVFAKIKNTIPSAHFYDIAGGIDHADLIYYYNACDLMLLTSYHEGSNNSLKEAMACNLPVVSVPCGDAPERLRFVRHCYVSVKYDASELADAAINILKSGKRSNGREFTEQLSLSNVADQIIEVYNKVLEK